MHAGGGKRRPGLISAGGQGAGDAEVGQERLAVLGQQDVLRLDIAMYHSMAVRVIRANATSRVRRTASATGADPRAEDACREQASLPALHRGVAATKTSRRWAGQ